jgi:hypothetical protein
VYTTRDFITDLANALRVSRSEIETINRYAELILEDALCRCGAVETPFGVIKSVSKTGHWKIKVILTPKKALEEKLTILAQEIE